jgi:hypothetical protein
MFLFEGLSKSRNGRSNGARAAGWFFLMREEYARTPPTATRARRRKSRADQFFLVELHACIVIIHTRGEVRTYIYR